MHRYVHTFMHVLTNKLGPGTKFSFSAKIQKYERLEGGCERPPERRVGFSQSHYATTLLRNWVPIPEEIKLRSNPTQGITLFHVQVLL